MTLSSMRIEHHDGVPVAFLDGDVDVANADRVGADLIDAVTNRAVGLVIVLSETRYLNSAGIGLLFRLNEQLATRRQRLALVLSPAAQLRRALEVSGVETAIPIRPDLPAALAQLGDDG